MPPSHNHTMQAVEAAAFADPGPSRGLGNAPMYQTPGALVAMASDALTPTGSSAPAPHANMQPFLTLNFIIALAGLYPSRS